jgi:hypothetical protein
MLGNPMTRIKAAVSARPGEFVAATALTAAFVVVRSIFLDRDLPPYAISQLQPIDEFFYTIPAFNLFHYGSMTYQVVPYIASDGSPLNYLQNLMTWLTLMAFGNNYYGLRMASVLAALGVFLLLFVVLRRQAPISATRNIGGSWPTTMGLLWMGYLLFDFAFAVSARVNEPTIFRMFAMVALIAVATLWPRERSGLARPFALGWLATAAFVFVYVYNAFLVPAILLTVLVDGLAGGRWQAIKEAGAAAAGCLLAVATYAVVVYVTYGQSLVQVYRLYVSPLGHNVVPHDLSTFIAHFYAIAGTNMFRFNVPLLVVFLAAIPVFAHRTWSERSSTGLLVGSLLFFLILQSEFAIDYPLKKLVMMSPLVVIVVAMALGWIGPIVADVRKAPALLIPLGLYVAGAAWVVFKVYTKTAGARVGYLADLNVLGLIVLSGALMVAVLARGGRQRALVTTVIAMLALPGAFLQGQQLFMNPTYRYRDAMIAAAPIINGHTTAGSISIGFRLYNSSVPVLNFYQYELLPGGMDVYHRDLERLFTDGTAQYIVTGISADPSLTEVARYKVDIVHFPYFVIYRRS